MEISPIRPPSRIFGSNFGVCPLSYSRVVQLRGMAVAIGTQPIPHNACGHANEIEPSGNGGTLTVVHPDSIASTGKDEHGRTRRR